MDRAPLNDRPMITDVHTHAFPDSLAERAIRTLEADSKGVKACLNGTVQDLLRSMDRAGIARSVICSIATKPDQFDKILRWSDAIRSERLMPLPSIHPDDPLAVDRVRQTASEGFAGIKMHPYYQAFDLDEEKVMPIYEAIADCGLVLVMHTGFDIAFPRVRRADAHRILRVINRFPQLIFMATHLGGWDDWDVVEQNLIGQPVWIEISFALGWAPPETIKRLLEKHPSDRLLFGSDSPWQDQACTLEKLKDIGLSPAREKAILSTNALRLFPK